MRLGAALGAIVDWQPALEQPDAEFQRVLEAIVHEMSTLRLRLLELPADAMAGYPAFFRPEAIARGEATLRALGCGFTVHLPYGGLDLASANETERGRSVATVLAAAERMAPLEASTYALHLTSHQLEEKLRRAAPPERRDLLARAADAGARSLRDIAPRVGPDRLCVENLGSVPPEPFVAAARATGVRLCLDVGHLGLQRRSILAYWRRHRSQIGEIHLHDVVRDHRGRLTDHQAVGDGILPLGDLLRQVEEAEFSGPVILEVNSRADLRRSVASVEALSAGTWIATTDGGSSPSTGCR